MEVYKTTTFTSNRTHSFPHEAKSALAPLVVKAKTPFQLEAINLNTQQSMEAQVHLLRLHYLPKQWLLRQKWSNYDPELCSRRGRDYMMM